VVLKILIEQSGHTLENMGDFAMLQVAIERLIQLWPEADIRVLTTNPGKLKEVCPRATPVVLPRPSSKALSAKLEDILPVSMALKISDLKFYLRLYLFKSFDKTTRKKSAPVDRYLDICTQAIKDADMVVCTGGGYMTDVFELKWRQILSFLSLARQFGKPTFMLGQGMGPIDQSEFPKAAAQDLNAVKLIALREGLAGLPLLKDLGIREEGVVVTGDDAIELAYGARRTELGNGIGVNLRMSYYSNTGISSFTTVRAAVQKIARAKKIPLVPIPITNSLNSDVHTVRALCAGYSGKFNAGLNLDTPIKVAAQVGNCRIVVTGSYHAAVFALSQGIPAVCLASSHYYVDKFQGLAEQFGPGCMVLFMGDEKFSSDLEESMEQAWQSAPLFRSQLLKSAGQQIEMSRKAYQRIFEITMSHSA
jgi:polysaccharide pyruvyl transferase WcaK-like protein